MSLSYAECETLSSTRRRKMANNTYLEWDDTTEGRVYHIRLHRTRIISFYRDGTVELNTGGWQTNTTKDRINVFSPLRVWQMNHVWYVSAPEIHQPIHFRELGVPEEEPREYEDGVRWHPQRGFISTNER